jgi:hypothetical protein
MNSKWGKHCFLSLLIFFCVFVSTTAFSSEDASLIGVTPGIREYAMGTVKPVLDSCSKKDTLSLLLKVCDVLIDPKLGIHTNEIKPSTYIIYDKLDKIKLGFLVTFSLSSEQKQILKARHSKFMRENPADVFFAPSADEIIRTKAAFGCSHYARSFVAVVKALGLVNNPEDLRYVISSKADDYNRALENKDSEMTINGHQFVLVKIASGWVAINTSKSEYTAMSEGFSPELIKPPHNIPVRFESYPDVTFLLRKIGKDYNDDCGDNSLAALMNISRSGDAHDPGFKWEGFADTGNRTVQ